jgi:chaperonin cofactor prefoldin
MVIKFIGGSSEAERFIVDYNELTLKSLQAELQNRNLDFTIDDDTIVNYSYQHAAGRNIGEITESTVLNLDPLTVVVITQQPRDTKARGYDQEELDEVIAEAKAALISNNFNDLKSACRELRQVSEEVKALIGNYTHYSKSTSDMFNAVERAVEFLSPKVTEVNNSDFQEIITRLQSLEAKVMSIKDVAEEIKFLREDVDFINQHFGLK